MSKNNTPSVSSETKSVELKLKLAKPYLEAFAEIKSRKDAMFWVESVPENLKTVILSLLAISKSENTLDFF